MYKVVVSYVDSILDSDEYIVISNDDVIVDTLIVQIKDVKGYLHTINKGKVENVTIYKGLDFDNVYSKGGYGKKHKYICNYGGVDNAIVYAKDEEDALLKYVESMEKIYSGIKKDECNCELYVDVKIID